MRIPQNCKRFCGIFYLLLTFFFAKAFLNRRGVVLSQAKPKKLTNKTPKKAVKCFIYPKHLTAFIMYEIFKNSFYKATLIPL